MCMCRPALWHAEGTAKSGAVTVSFKNCKQFCGLKGAAVPKVDSVCNTNDLCHTLAAPINFFVVFFLQTKPASASRG